MNSITITVELTSDEAESTSRKTFGRRPCSVTAGEDPTPFTDHLKHAKEWFNTSIDKLIAIGD